MVLQTVSMHEGKKISLKRKRKRGKISTAEKQAVEAVSLEIYAGYKYRRRTTHRASMKAFKSESESWLVKKPVQSSIGDARSVSCSSLHPPFLPSESGRGKRWHTGEKAPSS
jgi:hypothetical protein